MFNILHLNVIILLYLFIEKFTHLISDYLLNQFQKEILLSSMHLYNKKTNINFVAF